MFALNSGASGLNAYGEAMSIVGSNIANVNTTGFKNSRANFQEMLATAVKGTGQKIGKGVNIVTAQGDFTQGSLEGTNQITDLALEGEGFFHHPRQVQPDHLQPCRKLPVRQGRLPGHPAGQVRDGAGDEPDHQGADRLPDQGQGTRHHLAAPGHG